MPFYLNGLNSVYKKKKRNEMNYTLNCVLGRVLKWPRSFMHHENF